MRSRSWKRVRVSVLTIVFGFAACAATPKATSRSGAANAPPRLPPVTPSSAGMELEDARRYLLLLVNRDRSKQGLPRLTLDDAATRAGQRHAEDMARAGYTAHWGTDGSVPEQRYSDAGGADLAQENAGCLADGKPRALEPKPRFTAAELKRVERAFMDEKPPHDGHRRNILKATHTSLGLGIAKPVGLSLACIAQEFVDDYGDYAVLPKRVGTGSSLRIEGTLKGAIEFGGVGLARIDTQQPISAAQLNMTYTYPVPAPSELYFPKGFVTKKVVALDGKHFRIELPLAKSGRYEVSIWGKFPGAGQRLDMVSLRVVSAE